jgi:formylglycine-generating enzyme required for sulfatase activity
VISFSISHVWSKQLMSSLHAQVQTAVDAIQNTRGAGVVYALRELDNLPRELVQSELQLRYGSAVDSRKTGLAYALANLGRVDCEFLCSRIESLATDEVDNLATALREARDDSLRTIGIAVAAIQTGQDWRLKARLAITALHLGDDTIAADMCRIDGRHDPVQRTIFIDELSSWHGDLTRLATVAGTASDAPCRSAICLALAGISLDRLTAGEQETWKAILSKWYESAPDSGTHSASGLALRSWETELPQIPSLSLPGSHRDWYFNRLGITMIRIRAGRFFRARQEAPDSDFQTVTVTQDYFLGDREVSLGQFQQFVADGDCPSAEKPKDWNGSHGTASPTPAHPVQQVSWYDAVLFCNWLSRKEGLSLCYERTGEHEKSIFGQREYDGWRLIAGATGYRLPTEPQWEHASRAGTSTLFAFGNEEELMSRYVVFQGRRAEPCASRLPNGWGLFDMHGNVWEWCDSLDERLGGDDFQDSTLDSKRPQRVYRGGGWLGDAADCQSRNRQKLDPSIRSMDLGFRVARVVSPIE